MSKVKNASVDALELGWLVVHVFDVDSNDGGYDGSERDSNNPDLRDG